MQKLHISRNRVTMSPTLTLNQQGTNIRATAAVRAACHLWLCFAYAVLGGGDPLSRCQERQIDWFNFLLVWNWLCNWNSLVPPLPEAPFWDHRKSVLHEPPFLLSRKKWRLIEFSLLDTFEECCWWESGNDSILEVCFDMYSIKTNDLYFSHKH